MNPLLIFKLVGVIAVLAMAIGLWNKIQNIAELELVVDNQKQSINTLQGANNKTIDALDTCLTVNIGNKALADEAKQRAQRAEVRLAAFEAVANEDIEDISDDESKLRLASLSDETCYTLVDRLPDFLFD